jgi:biotin carboxyl carrier protein
MKLIVARGPKEREVEIQPSGAGYEVTVDGHRYHVEGRLGALTRVLMDGRPVEASVRRDGAGVIVDLGGREYSFHTRDARAPKLARRAGGDDSARGELHAPMPGLVVEVLAEVGQEVEAGRPLVVVEAMKMQNAFTAPVSGRIQSIHVKPGMPVESGQLLLLVTPEAS